MGTEYFGRKNLIDSTEIVINQTENGEYFPIEF